jgi:hypothetical protein
MGALNMLELDQWVGFEEIIMNANEGVMISTPPQPKPLLSIPLPKPCLPF